MDTIKEQILRMHQEGKTIANIAKTLNRSWNSTAYYIKPKRKPCRRTSTGIDFSTRKRKEMTSILKGIHGKVCRKCGYDRCTSAIDFHHVKPEEKEGTIQAYIRQGRFVGARKEAGKCILLCSNCHREFHAGFITLEGITPLPDDTESEETFAQVKKRLAQIEEKVS